MQHDIYYHNHNQPQEVQQQPGLVLPTHSMQSQIHELAKTLPPPRKQNTACDACRSRKVKCNRLPGQEKCQHCLSKNYPCTHYVQQATSERKRSQAVTRRSRNISSASTNISAPANPNSGLPFLEPTSANLPLLVRYGLAPPITLSTPTKDVVKFVFAAPEPTEVNVFPAGPVKSEYDPWGELASKLEDDTFQAEFALDLVEVFFQIVHTRIPLLNPEQFRNRLQLQSSAPLQGIPPLHPALVAVVLAWGTKFSEHPLLVADRKRPGGQSLMAKTLIDRARDLAEAMKVHRIPSSDHVVIALLIEPLQCQNPDDPSGHHGFWIHTATRHLLDLGINHKSVMVNIRDPENRGTMIFAWWMTCISDAYSSAYYRRKPVLDDDDYDIDFYTAEPLPDPGDNQGPTPSPREILEFLGYYRASHSLARTARTMSRLLWRPSTDSDGIPYETLCTFTKALTEWRDEFLNVVGVPSNFEGEWDFVSAVSSCASDATYHVMWIILFNALDDFGVKEQYNSTSYAANHNEIEATKRKVAEEALHGALRISGLAGVLTANGYLRLDTAVMYIILILAGHLLARLGRPEVANCIEGLKQYSYAYEEAGDQANEISKTFNRVRMGELDLNHMASVTQRVTPVPSPTGSSNSPGSQPMLVDEQQQPIHRNGSSHPFATTTGNFLKPTIYGRD